MIPKAFITEWRSHVPWQTNEQVEQDLVISRALVEIFNDDTLSQTLVFRGGTALHKLYVKTQTRYSEDIDLVQRTPEPFGQVVDRIREKLSFLGEPKRNLKKHNFTLVYQFDSEFPPVLKLRLKVETNTREHFSVLGIKETPFLVQNSWFSGKTILKTFSLEELLATKLRALYQRRKGRDLYDLFMALSQNPNLDINGLLNCYRQYMSASVVTQPTREVFLKNLEEKMKNPEFLGDTTALIRADITYNQTEAFNFVKARLIEHI